MYLEKIKSAYPTILLIIFLSIGSLLTAHLIATRNYLLGPAIIAALCGMLVFVWMIRDYKMGIYFMFLLSVFMSFINRMMGTTLQFGVVLDAVAGITFIIMLFTDQHKKDW